MPTPGSVWNPNAWHWEERNRTDWALKQLEQIIDKEIKDLDLDFADTDITGDASSSVRKGKRILTYELNAKGKWVCEESKRKGDWTIIEYGPADVNDPDIGIVGESLDKELKTKIQNVLERSLSQFTKAFEDFENTEEINAHAKLLELAKTNPSLQPNTQTPTVRGLAPQEQINLPRHPEDASKGSLWNHNSYHWEEIDVQDKFVAALNKRLSQSIPYKFGSIEISECTAIGEMSMSVRRDQYKCVYDLAIEGSFCDAQNGLRGTFKAEDVMPTEDKLTVQITVTEDTKQLADVKKELQATLDSHIRAAVKEVEVQVPGALLPPQAGLAGQANQASQASPASQAA